MSDESTSGTATAGATSTAPAVAEPPASRDRHTAMFPHVARLAKGYDPNQVDECIGCGQMRPIVVSLGPDVRYCAECVEKDV